MIVVLKKDGTEKDKEVLLTNLIENDIQFNIVEENGVAFLAIQSEPLTVDSNWIKSFNIVKTIVCHEEKYKKASRLFKEEDTIIHVNGQVIGGNNLTIIAGPCAVEDKEQILQTAQMVKDSGVNIFRAGAFKPRTSPYSFQGLGKNAFDLISFAKKQVGLPVVTEIMDIRDIDSYKDIDILQIGARNMQNFSLLKEIGRDGRPVILKRGFANTVEEWLLSAEYIMLSGNSNIILCERGIRTFEQEVRATLDLSAVAILKEKTHLPVIVDPSHALGNAKYVNRLSMAAIAAGANGIMVEAHYNPCVAKSDARQALNAMQLSNTVKTVTNIFNVLKNEQV